MAATSCLSQRGPLSARRLVNEHIRNRDTTEFCPKDRPRFSEYKLALQFKAQMVRVHLKDRLARVGKRGRRNHKGQATSGALASRGAALEPRGHPAPTRDDRDFNALDDVCPPVESLDFSLNRLKVHWKSSPVDLREDEFAHLLHRNELELAARLRLDCATYLTSKRRIFLRRLDCARNGKNFRKTDAQKACRIDVNKASRLWTAFDSVGWLDLYWMSKFL